MKRPLVQIVLLLGALPLPGPMVSAQEGPPADRPFHRSEPVASPARRETARPKGPPSLSQRMESEGVAVDLSIEAMGKAGLVAGADALVSLRATDARSGQPIAGLHPLAWISSGRSERARSDAECKDTIRSFMSGLLGARPDVDLNSYLLLTLNHDRTISVINPQVSFSITKLEGLVTLPGLGAEWALSNDKETLYVTVPDESAVAVVDTIKHRVASTIDTGERTRPTRIALAPDGRRVWVGLDGSPAVAVVDTRTHGLVRKVRTGAGRHEIAFTSDARFAYVTNGTAGTVSAIDTRTLERVADIAVGKSPGPVAYSSASRFVYVADTEGEHVTVIDPARRKVVAKIPARRGIVALRFDPEGRYGFAVNRAASEVAVIDASTSRVIASIPVEKSPDQVVFTRGYAYVRSTESEKFSLIELGDVRKGKYQRVDIQAGQLPASAAPGEIGVASMIAPTPEGNAVMIANGPDSTIYYYVEGMMAAMGSFSNYKRRPHALVLVDRSLTETSPGVYSSPVRLTKGGRLDVAVLIDQPRLTHCFRLELAPSPGASLARAAVAVEPLFEGSRIKPGQAAELTFKITDPATGKPLEGLEDVLVLIVEPPGVWQARSWAEDLGEGLYRVKQAFPQPGFYKVALGVESRGVQLNTFPPVSVPVVGE